MLLKVGVFLYPSMSLVFLGQLCHDKPSFADYQVICYCVLQYSLSLRITLAVSMFTVISP